MGNLSFACRIDLIDYRWDDMKLQYDAAGFEILIPGFYIMSVHTYTHTKCCKSMVGLWVWPTNFELLLLHGPSTCSHLIPACPMRQKTGFLGVLFQLLVDSRQLFIIIISFFCCCCFLVDA